MRTAPATDPATEVAAVDSLEKGEVVRLVLRFVLGLLVMCVLAGVVGYLARKPAEALALGFVSRFGVWGMALGTLLADSFHFPVPPQFYMLLAVASNTPTVHAFPAIAAASLVSGGIGYQLAKWASQVAWLAGKTERYRRVLAAAFERRGYRIALVASLLPIPYSLLCYLAGLNRMPAAFLALIGVCRVPKLLGFYGLVYFGWTLS
jgi:membrane protein YqaA with SNARE-associated domain